MSRENLHNFDQTQLACVNIWSKFNNLGSCPNQLPVISKKNFVIISWIGWTTTILPKMVKNHFGRPFFEFFNQSDMNFLKNDIFSVWDEKFKQLAFIWYQYFYIQQLFWYEIFKIKILGFSDFHKIEHKE